ncbi:hypothetical protein IC575_030011 [Cucumis melo]
MVPSLRLSTTSGIALDDEDASSYIRLIGRLLYLQISRPNISYCVHKLSQFLAKPHTEHIIAAHHLLRYLKGTSGQGIMLWASKEFNIKVFVDSDWGCCLDTRKSITGFCIFLEKSLVSWKTKKQATVSRSSAEAEYRALASVSSEITWLTHLLQNFQIPHQEPALIYCDNRAAISIASNPTFHERTKHIEIDCHFIHDKIQQGQQKLLSIKSSHQLADMFTKPLPSSTIHEFMFKMGIRNLHTPS